MEDDQRVFPAAAAPSLNGAVIVATPETASHSYVIQLPKDQVYRAAPTQQRSIHPRPPRRRRNPCCCCIAWIFCLIIFIIALIGIAAAVLYIIFSPQLPKYSLDSISVDQFNISQAQRLSSDLVVSIQVQNPNKKIGIYYDDGNRLSVLFSGREISSGTMPAFFQAPRNTTPVHIRLTASSVPFSAVLQSSLNADQTKGSVPLDVEMDEPVKLKIGSLKTPKVTVQLRCSLTVNQLTEKQTVRIQHESCSFKIKL